MLARHLPWARYIFTETLPLTCQPDALTSLSGSCKQECGEYEMGDNRSLIEEDNDGAVTWQIGFITQQSPRVTQTSQSHVCVTLTVTGRLVALQADNKCVSSHYRAGNPANSPRGWVTSGLVSTWPHNPSHRHSHSLTYHLPGGCWHRFKGLPKLYMTIVDSGRHTKIQILDSYLWQTK